ncbi:MAG TPA: multicopper oxidase domain-containing protein [Intrasporangium sp.]|uniref:multicopper oxidase domain-containing protein n=1 Tax=Intrasporangium sp. TaxID=1925024 RepID=UPI002D76A621|nr:multicopper oxidase domain-containing protein [Intrasporangium sp.]HET7398843.1 multicopper oxidase domain-containing protein [Intrasporangium sp.]
MSARGRWLLRDRPVVLWLGLAVLVSLVHPFFAASRWLLVHLVVLGAVTHSILVWSTHFTDALLKTSPDLESRRRQSQRLTTLLVGASLVFVGVPTAVWPVTVAGATLVSAAVLWHAVGLVRRLRAALPGRFRITVRYYVTAALCLPVGATFGVLLARGHGDAGHGRLLVAHTMTMLLGWVGLTVLGTLVTLWPTMLRTRMDPRAEATSRRALPVLVAGLALVVTGPLLDRPVVGAAGAAVYLAGACWTGVPLLSAARRKPPVTFGPLSAGAGLLWLPVGLVLLGSGLLTDGSWAALADRYGRLTAVFVVGFAVQVLLGALSHLIPVVLGGGPSVLRAGLAELERLGTLRVVVTNLGLGLSLLPVPSLARVALTSLVLLALASFLPLMFRGIHAAVRAKRAALSTQGPGAPSPERYAAPAAPSWSRPQLVAGVAVVALAATVGVGLDPAAAGLGGGRTSSVVVTPTGRTTRVTVTASGMRFSPSEVRVPVGDALVIDLVNADASDVHDLALEGGVTSGRLAPGERRTVEAGLVAADVEGWCSVVGHRQMGMTFSVKALGTPAPAAPAPGAAAPAPGAAAPLQASPARPAIDFARRAEAGFTAYDPVLPPLTDDRVRRVTLTVEEVEVEVAPGVRQRRWTYNGATPGPTLHGRVGDVFEVTLVNRGSMGHSVDFHAGEVAPDAPTRTIAPGHSLVYRFTASRAGIWMYHCSTMPMSAHIAAGMAGAVVIEPPGLPPVARSYVLVQSEVYLGAPGAEVDADTVRAERPDAVVFNGMANQYVDRPLTARAGERVRLWVLDAGPNRPSSFHVVGGQFDTVYSEGAYLLRAGHDALDPAGAGTGAPGPGGGGSGGGGPGGAQVIALGPGQGGFVELSLPEPGTYPLVSHVMVDAERGARGLLRVTP